MYTATWQTSSVCASCLYVYAAHCVNLQLHTYMLHRSKMHDFSTPFAYVLRTDAYVFKDGSCISAIRDS